MRRNALTIIALLFSVNQAAAAGTFVPRPYLAEGGVETLNRDVSNRLLDRDLFGTPWATVVLGRVDVYAGFPYLESRHFQVVSDPDWNRLLLGEIESGLTAFDGIGTSVGPLAGPRGLAVDDQGLIYVADTGNDRVLVFRAVTEFDVISLEPVQVIDGLATPYDLDVSDGGTPFAPADDRLYVANTGRNEVRRYVREGDTWRLTGGLGDLGSGPGRFAGPVALAVGHDAGAGSDDVYVADAHNGRVVHLRDSGGSLQWTGEWRHELGIVTSLASDHWGNVYAAAPQKGDVVKLTPQLQPVAGLAGPATRPRSFHIPFVTVNDHRAGTVKRAGEGRGVLVEQWSRESGLRLLDLGVELRDASVVDGDAVAVSLTLTDQALVSVEIRHPVSGQVVARHEAGRLDPGTQTISFTDADRLQDWDAGLYRVTVKAASTYEEGFGAEVALDADLRAAAGGDLPRRLELLGNFPNPFNPTTTISFTVPAGPDVTHTLTVYDARGRLVRELGRGPVGPGLHEVIWDGRDHDGAAVGSGMYLYRLQVGENKQTGKMVLLK